jgi:hypothetical protein
VSGLYGSYRTRKRLSLDQVCLLLIGEYSVTLHCLYVAAHGPDTSHDPKYQKALDEMMKRIKTGNALKPVMQRKLSLPNQESSAIGELQNILVSAFSIHQPFKS